MPDRRVRGIRGAITVDRDDPEAIHEGTLTLVRAIMARNQVEPDQVVSAIFTATPDLRSAFPAPAARAAGWHEVPMLCATELDVAGALPRCIRVLVHVERENGAAEIEHVYLGSAAGLRPDLYHSG
ncbi:MAG TPA: chorismate mutase [Gemmatimonadaceae bacterium]|nr:chorismate mutase [Gemmatimonadaceae bacterium]